MLKEERHQYILQKLLENRKVISLELQKELQVSDDTIRRDLQELADIGLIKKVHGGAIPKPELPYDMNERLHISETEKQIIAEKAIGLFSDDQVIILDNGTTNLLVAKLLPSTLKATIFTNSLQIAHELVTHPEVETIMLGGKIFKQAQAAIGIETVESLAMIRADWCLIGVCSIHPEVGVTSQSREESQVKRKMVEVSQKIIATATYDKMNTAENFLVCTTESLDILITDNRIEKTLLQQYEKMDIQIL
ncbi:DeoR/GlpR family DNA-binding transcription regulator [Cytophagaceae bacterium YF14B1]|uniref:DeoR/GlpR family DNA-binding transcription regulator n=1 Tax=Xanthocytophaga flava TaxID=3048013 RepID=A0AAE3QRC1_9BACT|nr:DeoR/GlpR family DNA-binding transcription regulator [Xanthocytophaga flavus]MDJ1482090.1 DeoR/GlpR family DNA-binding transcription regulator [Xanthocytophaga flavus]